MKMTTVFTCWWVVVLLAIMAMVSQSRKVRSDTTPLNKRQTIALHHAVKKLLGFRDLPHKMEEGSAGFGVPRPLHVKSNSLSPPQYMLDLYQRYRYSAISNGKQTGNTVRCINADIGLVNGERMLIFNLSSIRATEKVFSGEIHVYRKQMKSRLNRSGNFLRLHVVAQTHITEGGDVRMHSGGYGWQSYDVTSVVEDCISPRKRKPDILAVSFASKKGDRKPHRVALESFLDHVTMPFLIIYSNDTQNITLDHVDPRIGPGDMNEDIIDPEFGYDSTKRHRKKKGRRRRIGLDISSSVEGVDDVKGKEQHPKNDTHTSGHNKKRHSETIQRQRRSILDNEIPESPVDPVESDPPFNMPRSHPGILHSRLTSRHKDESTTSNSEDVDNDEDDDETIVVDGWKKNTNTEKKGKQNNKLDTSNLIPYPDEFMKRKRRRKNRNRNHRRRQNHHRRRLPLPPAWEAELARDENLPSVNGRDQLCSMRKLAVDFADIGWSDWIISPKSFEAHYCAGQCPFPLTKDLRPSNHATIQSLVHAIGIPADVPAPCCVPDVLSSVTLLYFDENRNVVLKNYPSMSVQSCACR